MYQVTSLEGCVGYVKARCEYAVVDSDGGVCYCSTKTKPHAEFIANSLNSDWRVLCCKFIGRARKLENFKTKKLPKLLVSKQTNLVQKAYDLMEKACLKDPEYMFVWEG